MAKSIVDYFDSRNVRLQPQIMDNLAEQITQYFPTENKVIMALIFFSGYYHIFFRKLGMIGIAGAFKRVAIMQSGERVRIVRNVK